MDFEWEGPRRYHPHVGRSGICRKARGGKNVDFCVEMFGFCSEMFGFCTQHVDFFIEMFGFCSEMFGFCTNNVRFSIGNVWILQEKITVVLPTEFQVRSTCCLYIHAGD